MFYGRGLLSIRGHMHRGAKRNMLKLARQRPHEQVTRCAKLWSRMEGKDDPLYGARHNDSSQAPCSALATIVADIKSQGM